VARPAKPRAEQILDLIEARAVGLRTAGVLEIDIDGWSVKLAPSRPADTAPPSDVQATPRLDDSDPLNDPATFGQPDGTMAPGFRHRVQRGDDEP
jgi:hypothetical protein